MLVSWSSSSERDAEAPCCTRGIDPDAPADPEGCADRLRDDPDAEGGAALTPARLAALPRRPRSATNSAAVWYRSSGDFAIARSTTSSMPAGRSDRSVLIAGHGSWTCAHNTATSLSL